MAVFCCGGQERGSGVDGLFRLGSTAGHERTRVSVRAGGCGGLRSPLVTLSCWAQDPELSSRGKKGLRRREGIRACGPPRKGCLEWTRASHVQASHRAGAHSFSASGTLQSVQVPPDPRSWLTVPTWIRLCPPPSLRPRCACVPHRATETHTDPRCPLQGLARSLASPPGPSGTVRLAGCR